jgi:hypothetical protein
MQLQYDRSMKRTYIFWAGGTWRKEIPEIQRPTARSKTKPHSVYKQCTGLYLNFEYVLQVLNYNKLQCYIDNKDDISCAIAVSCFLDQAT